VGNNWNAAVSMLKQDYKEGETSLQDALDLAIKVDFHHTWFKQCWGSGTGFAGSELRIRIFPFLVNMLSGLKYR
jgi:hypothetical protein